MAALRILVLSTMIAVTVSAHCGFNQQPPVAEVGGKKLLMSDIDLTFFEHLPDSARSASLVNYVNDWVDRELLYQEAQRNKIKLTGRQEKEIERIRISMVVNNLLNERFRQIIAVTDDDIRMYYDDHISDFTADTEYIRFSALQTSDRSLRQTIQGEISAGSDIVDIYEKYAGRCEIVSLGDDYFKAGNLLPAYAAAMRQRQNDSDYFTTEIGGTYYFTKISEFIESGAPKLFSMVEGEIRNMLLLKKRQDKYHELVELLRSNPEHRINTDLILSGSVSR